MKNTQWVEKIHYHLGHYNFHGIFIKYKKSRSFGLGSRIGDMWDESNIELSANVYTFYTANILVVKNTTLRCILFPMNFQCTFSTQEMVVANGCIKCNETTALNTSFTCKKSAMKLLL